MNRYPIYQETVNVTRYPSATRSNIATKKKKKKNRKRHKSIQFSPNHRRISSLTGCRGPQSSVITSTAVARHYLPPCLFFSDKDQPECFAIGEACSKGAGGVPRRCQGKPRLRQLGSSVAAAMSVGSAMGDARLSTMVTFQPRHARHQRIRRLPQSVGHIYQFLYAVCW